MKKREIRERISSIIGKKCNDFPENKIEQSNIISFDIFDTLVCRRCIYPERIFNLVEEKYNTSHDEKIPFAELRHKAEICARNKSEKQEVTLNEIYSNIFNISNEKNELFKELEICTELDNAIPNKEMVDFYNSCMELGKQIVIVSDMYLSKEIIKKVLLKCGVKGFSQLYISSEYFMSKRKGGLFEIVKKDFNQSEKIVHIGDHIISDYLSPRKYGIDSILYIKK